SLIGQYFIRYYDMLGDETPKIQEILKNMESNDINYHYNTLYKLLDGEWLKSSSMQELEKLKERSKQYKQKYYELMFDFMIVSRKADIDGMLKLLDEINENSYNNEKFKILTANLYLKLKDDKTKCISMLEEMAKEKDIYEVNNLLIGHYNDLNRKEDVKKIITDRIKNYGYLNNFRDDYINILVNENKYTKALELIDENLSYFPYSFTNFEKKANIYSLLKNDKETEKYIRMSLVHNSGNGALRKQLYDITKTPDEIEEVATKDVYKLAKERRNSKLKSDYGVITLLDEYIVNILPEGGKKSKVTYLYEITTESGIEDMKEYSLSSNNTILKSEIIKPDGSIVPAEKGDDTLVFSNLKVGDLIYIQYERYENSSGRFYKDFNISCYFNSTYPSVESSFTLIHPADLKYITDFSNGVVPSTTRKVNGKTCTIWKRTNIDAIPLQENYSPNFNDLTNTIRVGTIKSWKEISNWYADLVKKNLKTDKITKNTFNEIFPKGVQGISQEDIAKKIYTYIGTNIKYSSLDFRQSGYVPQKPAKTIITHLGDCKDVSTLFVALSELAGLKSNLVLVLTNDNGFNSMKLPSKDFNHCIVRTTIDNKEVFLELTDKYLPFRALPSSLYKANALVISFDKAVNENSKLINIPFDNALQNVSKTFSVVTIDDKSKTFVNQHFIQGSGKSYYNELFSSSTTEDVRKKEMESSFNTRLKKVISLQSVKLLSNDIFDKEIEYESKFSISESLQKVGSLKITEIPFLDNAYTRDVISTETRHFDLNYLGYENNNEYDSEVILNIPADKSFSEIPENKTLNFKNHNYTIAYQLLNKNSLKVTRKVNIPWDNIAISDYSNYKKFVESVIETEEQIVGFK
ncbi:MAG: transglutaminase domain-containing protein, partial [Flavobacterium sp.]